jgi:hypothetical protein
MLIHDHCCPTCRLVCKKLECERRGDVIGDVGNTEVKVGQLCLQEIAFDDL